MSECQKCKKNKHVSAGPMEVAKLSSTPYTQGCSDCQQTLPGYEAITSLCNTGIYGDDFMMSFAWNKQYLCESGTYKTHDFPVEIIGFNPKDTLMPTPLACSPHHMWERKNKNLIVRDTTIEGPEDLMATEGGQIVYKKSSVIPSEAIGAGYPASSLSNLCEAIAKCFDGTIQPNSGCGNLLGVQKPQFEVGKCLTKDPETGVISLALEGAQTSGITTEITSECKILSILKYRNTTCIELNIDSGGLYATPIIDNSDPDNILECTAKGLVAKVCDKEGIISSYIKSEEDAPGVDFSFKGDTLAEGQCIVAVKQFPSLPQPPKAAPAGYCWHADIHVQTNGANTLALNSDSKISVTASIQFNGSTDTIVGNGYVAEDGGLVLGDSPTSLQDPKLNMSGVFNANDTGNTASVLYKICYQPGTDVSVQEFCFNNTFITGTYKLIKCL